MKLHFCTSYRLFPIFSSLPCIYKHWQLCYLNRCNTLGSSQPTIFIQGWRQWLCSRPRKDLHAVEAQKNPTTKAQSHSFLGGWALVQMNSILHTTVVPVLETVEPWHHCCTAMQSLNQVQDSIIFLFGCGWQNGWIQCLVLWTYFSGGRVSEVEDPLWVISKTPLVYSSPIMDWSHPLPSFWHHLSTFSSFFLWLPLRSVPPIFPFLSS